MEGRFLAGRSAVITGGGRGIGAAIARALADAGADIALLGRTRDVLEESAGVLRERAGVRATTHVCDVSDASSIAEAFAAVREVCDPYILVSNAGQAEASPFDGPLEIWHRLLAVNLTGTYLCAREVLPAMIAAGAGRVINVASTAGLKGGAKLSAYSASKHGAVGLTKSLALETARNGVTVNAVCPGYTETAMADRAVAAIERTGRSHDEALRLITRPNPQGRLVRTEEVANAVLWLCTPDASAVTGQAIVVAGGEQV
jgi:NAD(P)-dependent dehydrogenase (short-subunit alcohol dehydrogenase family)